MGIWLDYLATYDDDEDATIQLARDLMRGDAATFKAGYTAPNAYLAAIEAAERDGIHFSGEQLEAIRRAVGA